MMSLDNGQIYGAKGVKHLLKVALYDSHRHTGGLGFSFKCPGVHGDIKVAW